MLAAASCWGIDEGMSYATPLGEGAWKLVPVSSRLLPVPFNPALYPFTVINHIYEYNSF